MTDIVERFARNNGLTIENISKLNIIEYNKRTYEAITEDILLYYITREGNEEVKNMLEILNIIADDGEDKIIIYYKEDYYCNSLDYIKIEGINKWYNEIGTIDNDYMCELCYKKFFTDIDNQSINCSICNYKYCSECIMNYVIKEYKCYNCKNEWKGKLTIIKY
jgi:hypothetical protein